MKIVEYRPNIQHIKPWRIFYLKFSVRAFLADGLICQSSESNACRIYLNVFQKMNMYLKLSKPV